jgi:hypothetical protein
MQHQTAAARMHGVSEPGLRSSRSFSATAWFPSPICSITLAGAKPAPGNGRFYSY